MRARWAVLFCCSVIGCGNGAEGIEPTDVGPSDVAVEATELEDVGDGDPGSPPECVKTADCPPAAEPACRRVRCEDGRCVKEDLVDGTLLPMARQTAGDCRELVCDGHGGVRSRAEGDPPPSSECVTRSCDGETPKETNVATGTKCTTGVCLEGACVPTLCTSGKKDGDETDVDCGGSCVACATGKACAAPADCVSRVCSAGSCAAPSCTDAVKNGGETDVDCGGACPKCADGKGCSAASDCVSSVCTASACVAPTCGDAVKNGSETDVDCGGTCGKCADGKACSAPSDCTSLVCGSGACSKPSCSDAVKNGGETAVDCGGACAPCALGVACKVHGDCASGWCVAGTCTAPSCTDGAKNGSETDVDCGGSCGPCARTRGCAVDADCATTACFAGRCAWPRFALEGAQAYPAGTAAGIEMLPFDVDVDGKPDVLKLTGTWDTGAIVVLRNLGGRRFAPSITVPTAERPIAFAAGDVDKDGERDVIVAFYGKVGDIGGLAVHRGDGLGLLPATRYAFEGPRALAVGDLDGDGDTDVVVANYAETAVFKAGAGGVLNKAATIATPAVGLALVDVDGDGDLDVLATEQYGSDLVVHRNDGTGAFGPAVRSAAATTSQLAVGDFDLDAVPDVFLNSVSIPLLARGKGDGTFTPAVSLYPDIGIASYGPATTLDVNGDGLLDLALGLRDGNEWLRLAFGKGNGTFEYRSIELAHDSFTFAASDLDGDCRTDFALADPYGTIDVVFAQGGGNFPSPPHASIKSTAHAIADVDGDGRPDVVAVNARSGADALIFVWRNLGGGKLADPVYHSSKDMPYGLVVRDLDGDGRVDFATATYNSKVWVHLRGSDGSLLAPISYPLASPATAMTSGDVDGDGKVDLVVGTAYAGTGQISVLRGKGDGTFLPRYDSSLGSIGSVALADFDGDGDLDLLAHRASVGTFVVLRNDGAGGFTTQHTLSAPVASRTYADDVDDDGRPDVIGVSNTAELIAIYRNTGAAFASPVFVPTYAEPESVAFGDVDGDGRTDLLVSSARGVVSVHRARGGLAFDPPTYWASYRTSERSDVAVADLDADGKLDVIPFGIEVSYLRNVSGWSPLACPVCADGVRGEPESCDDGNAVDGDGCNKTCLQETGWSCTGSKSVCTPICGDRLLRGSETCDDGNATGGDGCSATCNTEVGWTCSPPVLKTASACLPICGDGLVRGDELCDDGNTSDGDACPSTCRAALWARAYGDTKQQSAGFVAAHPSGGAVVAGLFEGTINLGGAPLIAPSRDAFVARIDDKGTHVWSRRFTSGYTWPYALAVDASGNTWFGGTFSGTIDLGGGPVSAVGGADAFLVELDPAGNHLRSFRFGGSGGQSIRAIAFDATGVYVAGAFDGTLDLGGGALTSAGATDMFVAKLSPTGGHLWSYRWGDATKPQVAHALAVDPAGNVYVGGEYDGTLDLGVAVLTTLDATNAFVAKLSPAGTPQWAQSFGVSNNYDYLGALAIDAGGVVASGTFRSEVVLGGVTHVTKGEDDGFVLALDPSGAHRWSRVFGAPGRQTGFALSVDDAGAGVVRLVANTDGALDIGGTVVPLGTFAAKLSLTSGATVSSAAWSGGTFSAIGTNKGAVYASGQISAAMSLVSPALTPTGSGDALLVRLAP